MNNFCYSWHTFHKMNAGSQHCLQCMNICGFDVEGRGCLKEKKYILQINLIEHKPTQLPVIIIIMSRKWPSREKD